MVIPPQPRAGRDARRDIIVRTPPTPSLSSLRAALALLPCLAASLQAAPNLTVSAAANVQFALEEVKAAFSEAHGAEVKSVYSSSGKLASQIRNGAPFDVFVSADMAFPDSLFKWGLAAEKAKPYALGLLVLWTLRTDLDPARGLPLLAEARIKKVALPDPALAPYGKEALAALAMAGRELEAAVKTKLVYAQNIGQTGQFILTGAADIGFNAKSVVLAPDMRGKGKWADLDRDAYRPIAQGAVVLKHGMENNPDLARKFLAFLCSETSRTIFSRYGYLLP